MFNKFPKISRLENLTLGDREALFKYAMYVDVYEKIDGSHIGIYLCTKTREFRCYTRNGMDFNMGDFTTKIKEHLRDTLFNFVEKYFSHTEEFYFEGEVFGPRILNRLKYPQETQIRLYHFYLRNEEGGWIFYDPGCPDELEEYWEAPIFTVYNTKSIKDFKETIERLTPLPFNSAYTTDNSNAEGYVFYFYYKDQEDPIMIKKKDAAFEDRSSIKKKVSVDLSNEDMNELVTLKEEFRTYLTDNRIHDVASKGYSKISILIPAIMKDAQEDFERDHPDLDLKFTKSTLKSIYNVGASLYLRVVSLGYK